MPLDEFLPKYKANDNEWWYLETGDMQNLFEEAVDQREEARTKLIRIREICEDYLDYDTHALHEILHIIDGNI